MSHIEPHDEFLELCALATSGQLTREEQGSLREHLAACASCREILAQYETVVGQVMPAIAANEAPEKLESGPAWSLQRAESALFEHIARDEQGATPERKIRSQIEPNHDALQFPFAGAATWRRVWALYAAAIMLALALGLCAYRVGMRQGVSIAEVVPSQSKLDTEPALEAQLSDAGHDREMARAQLTQRDREIADLRRQLERQARAVNQMKLAQDRLEHDLSAAGVGRQELIAQQSELAQKLAAAQAQGQSVQRNLDALEQLSSQDGSRARMLEAKVSELTRQLHEREATIEQQQQLLAHDRDIRELMGARDLYIAEVYDVARDGRTQTPYGRVFYTKGKSLIFYAYDLDQDPRVKDAKSFQAWGRRGPDRQQALNLGIFYIDSAAKKRWMLKFDDPRMLAQIDAVFVTVEPNGGSHKPSGKSLLFAYLRVDANHP